MFYGNGLCGWLGGLHDKSDSPANESDADVIVANDYAGGFDCLCLLAQSRQP